MCVLIFEMSFLLPALKNKSEVDEVIRKTEDKVVVIRFGREDEEKCIILDHILSKALPLLANMACIYTVDINAVPIYVQYFDITLHPATVFFFNAQHIKVDFGTADHTKFIGVFREKQDLIDLVEVIFRNALRGKLMVRSPIDYCKVEKFDLLYKDL